jgi:hypothetical protein
MSKLSQLRAAHGVDQAALQQYAQTKRSSTKAGTLNSMECIILGFVGQDGVLEPQPNYVSSGPGGKRKDYTEVTVMLIGMSEIPAGDTVRINPDTGAREFCMQVSYTDQNVLAYVSQHLDQFLNSTYTKSFPIETYYSPARWTEHKLVDKVWKTVPDFSIIKVKVWKDARKTLSSLVAGDICRIK